MKNVRKIKEPLYQAWVETKDEELMAISPKMNKEAVDRIADAMRLAMKLGKQPDVGNVHVRLVNAN